MPSGAARNPLNAKPLNHQVPTAMNIPELIVTAAERGIHLCKAGLYPPGYNGPWEQMETPARNTCHWAVTNAKAYALTGNGAYKDLVYRSIKAILEQRFCPFSASFMILNANRSFPNGIVGQAWVMEALVAACRCLEDHHYLEVARRLALKHHFEPSVNLWAILNIDGTTGPIHSSLNQQLWFGVMSLVVAKLSNDENLLSTCDRFFANVHRHAWYAKDLIHMKINPRSFMAKRGRESRDLIRLLLTERKTQSEATVGYLPYTLFPLAMAWKLGANTKKELLPEAERCAKNFIKIPLSDLANNCYCFSYHPTGFEVAYILKALDINTEALSDADFWTSYQLENYYNHFLHSPEASTRPCPTLIARFHEITYLCPG